MDFNNLSPCNFSLQPIFAIIIKTWVTPIEKKVTKHLPVQSCVIANSLRNGIALWELQEQKCQHHVCQQTDVEQNTQVGKTVVILQWRMVKFTRMSALVMMLITIVNLRRKFLWKTVDPTSSTNFFIHLFVTHATVVQTEFEQIYPVY